MTDVVDRDELDPRRSGRAASGGASPHPDATPDDSTLNDVSSLHGSHAYDPADGLGDGSLEGQYDQYGEYGNEFDGPVDGSRTQAGGEPEDLRDDGASGGTEGAVAGDAGDAELVTVGAAGAKAGSRPVVRTIGGAVSTGRDRKAKATPKQRQDARGPRRTTPTRFVQESVGELRKVVYPTGPQLANYFVVVLVFVLFVIAVVGLLDLGLGAAIFRIFR